MSPIPSVATAFTFSSPAPSVALDPDSAEQAASVMSHHLLGTGGLLFAVVAIVSVVGYFYHGPGSANGARTNNPWVSLISLLSSMRHRSSTTNSTVPVTDWPIDLEVGPEHVSMVYARFFHPTFWNFVEGHPPTPSAPAIYVEDEADEMPMPDARPHGIHSFLDVDDDDDGDGDNSEKDARKKPDHIGRPRIKELPPYDTSLWSNVNFVSRIIGTTVRPGAFLTVPGELEDDSSSDVEVDFPCSPYDGIVTSDPEPEFTYSPYDGIATTDSESGLSCSPYDGIATTETGSDLSCSSCYGIEMTPPRLSSGGRRYGMADMADLVQVPKDMIPGEGSALVPTISRRTGLLDLSNFVETDLTHFCGPSERRKLVDDTPTISNYDVDVHNSHDGSGGSLSDTDTVAAPQEGLDLMRKLLAELRDPDLDYTPRPLSEDSDSVYDDNNDDDASIPYFTTTWFLDNVMRHPLGSISSPGTDSDMSDEGPAYPLTPPSKPAVSLTSASHVHEDRISPPVVPGFKDEVLVMSHTSSDSPLMLPMKAYTRTHKGNRSCLYGPWVPLARLPSF